MNKKLAMKMTVGFIVSAAIALIIFVWLVITGGFPKETSKVEDYLCKENYLGHGQLLIFPEELPKYDDGITYYFYCRDTIFQPTCQIYLKCTYNEDDYEKECDRLSNISVTYEGQTQNIRFEENSFTLPAYVAMNGWCSCYEYALVNEAEHTIEYIYLQQNVEDAIKFDLDKLPDTFGIQEYEGLSEFSIYHFETPNGGYVSAY